MNPFLHFAFLSVRESVALERGKRDDIFPEGPDFVGTASSATIPPPQLRTSDVGTKQLIVDTGTDEIDYVDNADGTSY